VPKDFKMNGGVDGYVLFYDEFLRIYEGAYKIVLEHLRDRPGDTVLFHCSCITFFSQFTKVSSTNDVVQQEKTAPASLRPFCSLSLVTHQKRLQTITCLAASVLRLGVLRFLRG